MSHVALIKERDNAHHPSILACQLEQFYREGAHRVHGRPYYRSLAHYVKTADQDTEASMEIAQSAC